MVRFFKEAFQATSSPTAAAQPGQCPEGAIQGFPVTLDIAPTQLLYDSVTEPITIDFQWAVRSTPPQFLSSRKTEGVLDEVGAGTTGVSTLLYNNRSYSLAFAQLCTASHNSWLLGSQKAENKEDLLIVFSTPDTEVYFKHLLFIIPLLRKADATDPQYLRGVNGATQGPFSLKDCMPKNPKTQFAYYGSCLNSAVTNGRPEFVNIFISLQGVPVTPGLMTSILKKISEAAATFPSANPPFMTRFVQTAKKRIGADFTLFVLTSNELLNIEAASARAKAQLNTRIDDAASYKCVSLDPDADIQDGKLVIDADTGTPLTSVLAERQEVRASDGEVSTVQPGSVQRQFAKGLGITLVCILGFVACYLLYVSAYPPAAAVAAAGAAAAVAPVPAPAGAPTPAPKPKLFSVENIPLFLLFGLIITGCVLIGVVIGKMV